MTQDEKELDETVKETECFCLVARKGLTSALKKEVSIPDEFL